MNKELRRWTPLFVWPTLTAFIIGFVWPFCRGLYLSFCRFITVGDAQWVGFENYITACKDPAFLYSFLLTCAFAVVSVVVINVSAFAIAKALTDHLPGRNVYRTVFFSPNLIGGIVLGYIWQLIINSFLAPYGTALALDARYGFWGLVILTAWQQIGYMMIIYIAGLQSVPDSLYEAARMDGATPRQILFKITLPMVMPSITVCTFLTLTGAFKLFDQNLALTAGAPGLQTGDTTLRLSEMLALNIYNTFYNSSAARGVGQAKAVLFSLLVAVIALLQLYWTKRREVQQ